MLRILTIFIAFFAFTTWSHSQKIGYQIKVKIDGFEEKEAYLGYFYGEKQYLRDTAYVETDGRIYFEGNKKLEPGIYMIVLPPDNKFIQILVNEDEQWFSLETKMENSDSNMKVEGSKDNQLFYSYLNFLAEKRPEAEDLKNKIQAEADEKKKAKLELKMEEIDNAVKNYQKELLTKNPNTLTAAIIKANQPLKVPEFKGEKEENEKTFFLLDAQPLV